MGKLKSVKEICIKFNYILNAKQKRYAALVFVLTSIGAIFETLGVSIIVPFVEALMNPEKLLQNGVIKKIYGILQIKSLDYIALVMGILIILLYLIKNLYLFFLSYIRSHFSTKIQKDLSVWLMQSYMKREYSFFTSVNTSELLQGIGGDISSIYLMLYNIFRVIAEIITVIAISIYILVTDMWMALIMIMLALMCFGGMVLIFQKPMSRLGKEFRRTNTLVNQYGIQAFQGIKEIIVTHRQSYFTAAYEKAAAKRQKSTIWQAVANEVPAYIIEAVCVTGLILAVAFRTMGDAGVEEYIPKLAAFVVAAFRILPSLGRISSGFNQFMYYSVSLNSVYSNLKEVELYEKEKLDRRIEAASVSEHVDREKAEYLTIENVTWQYRNNENPTIKSLNLKVREGESIALIGHSGAGKTTLADIILGLYHPCQGSVKYKGADIQSIPEEWCRIIGYIPQSIYLLDDTIKRNVAFGIEDEKIDEQMVWDALEQAQLRDFVDNLPDKLDTVLGERGVRFSGGQQQRIAIARALYYNPSILVLDEATSALDTETEKAVMDAVDQFQGRKTLIIIAHRLTTIKNCNIIYEIADGKAFLRNKADVLEGS